MKNDIARSRDLHHHPPRAPNSTIHLKPSMDMHPLYCRNNGCFDAHLFLFSKGTMALLFCHVPHTHTTNSTTGTIIAIFTIPVKTFVDQKMNVSTHSRYEILTSQTVN
jgi:hypothetical protein